VLIENNIFENNWADAQNGFAILFTPRNGGGTAPWNVVQDITFRRNIVRHSSSGVNILGTDYNHPTQQTKRILIQDNLFEDINGDKWGGHGILFQLLDGTADVVIEHNTGLQDGNIIKVEGARPHTGFVYRNNVTPHNHTGINGSETGQGNAALKRYFPGARVEKNVFAGGSDSTYPKDNFFPPSLDKLSFANRALGDYRLGDSSLAKKGTDGKDPGADFSLLADALKAKSGNSGRR
ncbi:MAG TPA: hypothetical protein VGL11_09650, partial [Candidatus Binatia bacterium]